MDKEKISSRISELKKANDEINQKLQQLEAERNNLIQQALQNNGAIIELEKLLKEE